MALRQLDTAPNHHRTTSLTSLAPLVSFLGFLPCPQYMETLYASLASSLNISRARPLVDEPWRPSSASASPDHCAHMPPPWHGCSYHLRPPRSSGLRRRASPRALEHRRHRPVPATLAMAKPCHGAIPLWPYHEDLGIRIGLYVLALMWDTPRPSPWPKRSPRTPTTLHLACADALQGAAVPCTFCLSPAASLDMVALMNSSLANCT